MKVPEIFVKSIYIYKDTVIPYLHEKNVCKRHRGPAQSTLSDSPKINSRNMNNTEMSNHQLIFHLSYTESHALSLRRHCE